MFVFEKTMSISPNKSSDSKVRIEDLSPSINKSPSSKISPASVAGMMFSPSSGSSSSVQTRLSSPQKRISIMEQSTPELTEKLNRIIEQKDPQKKPCGLDEVNIIKGFESIVERRAARANITPSRIYESYYSQIRTSVCSSVNEPSPAKQQEKAAQIIVNKSWAGGIANQCAEKLSDSKKRSLEQIQDMNHLKEQGHDGSGFHICYKDDDRWNFMTNIQASPTGAVTATWTCKKGREKTSTFFHPFMNSSQVGAELANITNLPEYEPKDPLAYLMKSTSGIILEARKHPQHSLIRKSCYPVFRWVSEEELSTSGSIPITRAVSLGGNTYSQDIDYTTFRINGICHQIMIDQEHSAISYINPNKQSVVLDISKKITECN